MNVLLFGAPGMIGQGVLRECLLAPDVERVVTVVGRSATGVTDPKLRELVHKDLWNFAPVESQLAGFDACFLCLGITSAGMSEADYTHITYDITMAVQ
jgi:putative NADH-flavin reductase